MARYQTISDWEADGRRVLKGSELTPADQLAVLSRYVHRFTGNHRPKWTIGAIWKEGKPYPLQFADDNDWLAHTLFAVTDSGRLSKRVHHCHSMPTWPNNPELRRSQGD